MSNNDLQKAASEIGVKPIFEFDGKVIHVVGILPRSPPLRSKWWHGKDVSIIGVDVDGNFFLRHCDGSVRYWEHSKQADVIVAKSVKEFCSRLREDVDQLLSLRNLRKPNANA
jgi:hypothetical protein